MKVRVLACMALIFTIEANERQEAFLKAATLYQQGNVADALSIYKSIEKKSSAILYNIGACYSVLGNYAQALIAFRRAEKNAGPSLMRKIEQGVTFLDGKLGKEEDSSWYRFFLMIEAYLSIFWIQLFFLFSLSCLLLLWWKRRLKTGVTAVIAMIALMTGSFCGVDYWVDAQRIAVAIEPNTVVFAGPNESFHALFSLPLGSEVKVVEEQQSWYKVYSNGAYGWVEQKKLELLM